MSIKKGTMPPSYDDAFKSGAIKMVTEQGRPSKEVAAELGICMAQACRLSARCNRSSKPH